MKVDTLLGPYLYQYKKLSLPGIGLFTLDENAVLPDNTAKIKTPIEGISFNAKTTQQIDDSLIQFIKDETGKMKALAEADLYSFIATASQYLNIGKPYYFEGIGTLQKNKDNAYVFTPGTMIQKAEEGIPRYQDTSKKSSYSGEAETASSNFNGGKLVVLLGVLVTIGLIAWGGYYLYNKNTAAVTEKETSQPPVTDTSTAAVPVDSTGKKPGETSDTVKKDSAATPPVARPDTNITTAGYKFILETTDKKMRALKRYAQLKDVVILKPYNDKVFLETKDSVSFNIYTSIACSPADTTHIKEQLSAWYYGNTSVKVKIAH